MNYRHISLSAQEKAALSALKRTSTNSRVIARAHALLLSAKGYQMDALVDIFEVGRDTVAEWFNRWEKEGIDGLQDAPKSGRPRSFTPEQEKKS